VDITSYRCKTNTQSHTAFRGFGGPQGVIAIETLLGDIARHLGLDPLAVRRRNLYGITERNVTHYQMAVEDNILQPLLERLEQTSSYGERRAQIAAWNANSPVLKRGLAMTPVKFGISALRQRRNPTRPARWCMSTRTAPCMVNHGGTEMGQGLHTEGGAGGGGRVPDRPRPREDHRDHDGQACRTPVPTAASSGRRSQRHAPRRTPRAMMRDRTWLIDLPLAWKAMQVPARSGGVPAGNRVISANASRFRSTEARPGRLTCQPYPALERPVSTSTPKIHWDKLQADRGHAVLLFRLWSGLLGSGPIDTLTGEICRAERTDILHDVPAPVR
jgi:CO/xanthine dehydrogenase Mo-binding subunit